MFSTCGTIAFLESCVEANLLSCLARFQLPSHGFYMELEIQRYMELEIQRPLA